MASLARGSRDMIGRIGGIGSGPILLGSPYGSRIDHEGDDISRTGRTDT